MFRIFCVLMIIGGIISAFSDDDRYAPPQHQVDDACEQVAKT